MEEVNLNFDDEKIADEKSIADMKIRYAGINKNIKVSTQSETKNFDKNEMISLGLKIKKQDKLFSFLKDMVSYDLKDFVEELRKVNMLELEKLMGAFDELKDVDTQNPELVKMPNSFFILSREIVENEIEIIKKLFATYSVEKREDEQKLLKQIIERRLNATQNIFL